MNEHMMMESGMTHDTGMAMDSMHAMMGPTLFGLDLASLLMVLAGIVYLGCAMFLWKPFRRERNELIGALFYFLIYQSISMFFMGIEMLTMNMLYGNIASLAVFIGSAYMLKFPFSKFSQTTRKGVFLGSIVIVLGLFLWFMQTEARQMQLMHFTLWYDLVINGILAGGSILLLGFMTSEKWLKLKAFGGGSGVVACCVVSNGAMLGGAMLAGTLFSFLAPVLILGSLSVAKKKQQSSGSDGVSTVTS